MTKYQTLPATSGHSRGLGRRVWAQPAGKIGLVLTIMMLTVAVFGQFLAQPITGYSPIEVIGLPFTDAGLTGTDIQGRSVTSRLLAGGFALVVYSVAATGIAVVLGTLFGLLAGYFGGFLDWVVMRCNDIILAFPALLLALLAVAVFAPSGGVIVVVIGLIQTPWIARGVRDGIRAVSSQDFILAARLSGQSHWSIIDREILPHVSGSITAEAAVRLTYSIGLVATLSFLGLGVQPPRADWGLMVNENLIGLSTQPWGVVLPALAIAALTTGVGLVAQALTRATAAPTSTDRGEHP